MFLILIMFKKPLIGLTLFIIALLLGHWICGYGYLFRGVAYSYLRGQSGPGINEAHLFYNDTIRSNNPVKTPSSKKINSTDLSSKAVETLQEIKTACFLVVKDDSLVYERYWEPYSQNTPTNTFSAAKSFVSLLVGVAIEQGYIESVDQPVGDFLVEFNSMEKSKITIRSLLTMSSGLNWGESGKNPYSDNAKAYYGQQLREQVNALELIEEPSKTFRYKSGDTQILVYVLEKATGYTLSDYFKINIWDKIEAESSALWNLDKKDGDEKGFCCFYGLPRDFAKIGLLVLHGGKWKNQQVVPNNYIKKAIVPAKEIREKNGEENFRYGWQWWAASYKGSTIHYARGLLGQYIIVYPKKRLVIVRTGEKRKKVLADGHPADLWDYLSFAEQVSK